MIAFELNAQGGVAIVPSDAPAGQGTFRGLYVGGAGDVTISGLDGNQVTLKAVPVGTQLWIGCNRVLATGTTATFIVGLT